MNRMNNPEDIGGMFAGLFGIAYFINLAIGIAYNVYFVSQFGATPGKMALNLKIIRASDGAMPSAGLALGRYLAYIIDFVTLYIGFIIAGFDSEKRALHDHICGTRVVYKS
jgi:uncharacterized RDD family membrane protein YckC